MPKRANEDDRNNNNEVSDQNIQTKRIKTPLTYDELRADDIRMAQKRKFDQVEDDNEPNMVVLETIPKRKLLQLGPILAKRFAHLKPTVNKPDS